MADAGSRQEPKGRGTRTVRVGTALACLVLAPWIVWAMFVAGLGCDELCTNAQSGPREGWQFQDGSWQWSAFGLLPIATLGATIVLIRAPSTGRTGRAAIALVDMVMAGGLWLIPYSTVWSLWS